MRSIILKRGQLVWLAEMLEDGAPDREVEALMGTHVLPTPFRLIHQPGEVALWVVQRNPGSNVEVQS